MIICVRNSEHFLAGKKNENLENGNKVLFEEIDLTGLFVNYSQIAFLAEENPQIWLDILRLDLSGGSLGP